MKIVFKDQSVNRLDYHVVELASKSIDQARSFKTELINQINQILLNPYNYPRSIYFEVDNIRDLSFKEHLIVFRITDTAIEILGIVKR